MTDEPNKEEYRIVEPKKDKKQVMEVKVMKAQGAVVAVMSRLILKKGDDLDMDNLFNVVGPHGKPVCILTDSIPCRSPHCKDCSMVHFYNDHVEDVLAVVSDKLAKDMLKSCRKELSDAKKQAIDDMMKVVMRAIEGESKDE